MKSKQQIKGFTLIELMVTVIVMSIMAAIAYPSMSQFIAKMRVINRTQQVANLFRYAKGEAVRMGVPVVICGDTVRTDGRPSGNCTSDVFDNASDDAKKSALKAFADKNQNGAYASADDIELRTIPINGKTNNPVVWMSIKYCNISGSNCVAATAPVQLAFVPSGKFGAQKDVAGKLAVDLSKHTVLISLTDARAEKDPHTRHVKVSPSGQVDICVGSDDDLKCDNNKK